MVQQEFNRLNNCNLSADRKRVIGKRMFEQIEKAAKFAAHNIPATRFTLANAEREYHVSKTAGVVKSYDIVFVA